MRYILFVWVLVISIIATHYGTKYYITKDINNYYFSDKDTQLIVNSDISNCGTSCGFSVVRINGSIYYSIENKEIVDKSFVLFNNGFDLHSDIKE